MVRQSAFVFIKPHAVTPSCESLVEASLKSKGISVTSTGTISSDVIDSSKLIDQHYYAIASKATLLKPSELNVPAEKFQEKFGVSWASVLAKGQAYNAADACKHFGVDAAGLDKLWGAAKKDGKLVKFGGGFYCGLVKDIYVFNGFFMSMRSRFTEPGKCIKYYVVEWDSKQLSWESFRGEVLGPTDPADAPADSLRGQIMAKWKSLGLETEPNTGDNGVHASASPFEALAEKMNWLGVKCQEDAFGKAMLDAGIPMKTIEAWSVDPQVTYGAKSMPIKKSIFDTLEDTDADYCLSLCMMVNGASAAPAASPSGSSGSCPVPYPHYTIGAGGVLVGFLIGALLLSK